MSLRTIFFGLLTADAQLTALIPATRMFGSGVIGAPGPNGQPITPPDITQGMWLSYRLDEHIVRVRDGRTAKALHQEAEVYVHDRPGSYNAIDTALDHTERIMAAAGAQTSGIFKLMQVDYQGRSPDLPDDAFGTFMRFNSFRMIYTTN